MDLLTNILEAARVQGLSQKVVAARAGVPEETLSRMKGRQAVKSDVLQKLAGAVGLQLALVPQPSSSPKMAAARQPFTQKYKALVWSNQNAPTEVFIRHALLRPDFSVLLDAAVEYGVPKLVKEWRVLEAEGSRESNRAAATTRRMLTHMGAKL